MKNRTLLLLALVAGLYAQSPETRAVPNLQLELLNGTTAVLQTYLDQGPVLIDFWATWCEPCKKELVFLRAFHEAYGDSGLTVLTVNQDSPRSLSKVKAFLTANRYTFPVVKDPNQQLSQKLNVQVMPTTLLVAADGKIVWQHVGFLPGDERDLEAQIRQVLAR